MSIDITDILVPYADGATVRDLFQLPHLAAHQMEDVVAMVVHPKRLAGLRQYLHRPSQKPGVPPKLPSGSIFRGVVFGNIVVYTNKTVDETGALVLIAAEESAPPSPQPAPTPAPAPAPPPSAPAKPASAPPGPGRMKIELVGRPKKQAPPAAEKPLDQSIADDLSFFSKGQPVPGQKTPSEEKLIRWTEIIPSDTRIRRPQYPPQKGAKPPTPTAADPVPPAPKPPMASLDNEATGFFERSGATPGPSEAEPAPPEPAKPEKAPETDVLPFDMSPSELQAADRIRLAKEADRLLFTLIKTLEDSTDLTADIRTDLVTEVRMLQLELDKFRPGIVRITDMIMNISKVNQTHGNIARLKECLRGLGLLL